MTHKLLLADDSVTIQRVVELTFSGEDVQVVTVGDGDQAIARIPVEQPDIVLADIGMPKRSGYDVAAFVKGRSDLAHIPVLLLAGAFEPVDEQRAQQVRSDGVLVKPFEPQQVISRVKELIERSKFEAAPNPPPPGPAVERQLDDYFDRLDAAFAGLASEPRMDIPPRSTEDHREEHELPTVDRLLSSPLAPSQRVGDSAGEHPPAEGTELASAFAGVPPVSGAAPVGETTGGNLVANMFAALFAAEQGEAVPSSGALPALRPDKPVVTESLVDEVTRRVIERLAPDAASELVTQIVSEVAERLIREEIARIKASVGARL